MRKIVLKKPLRFLTFIYAVIIVIFLTMPLRGEISILDSIKVGRDFLILPLAFLISYDVWKKNNLRYYKKLVFFIASITSIQILLNAFDPELISGIFEHVRAKEGTKYGMQRNHFLSKSMLFPHLGLLIISWQLLNKRYKKIYLFFFILFFFGSALQGFRSYFLGTILVLVFLLLKYWDYRKTGKTLVLLLFLPLLFAADQALLGQQISVKFTTIFLDLEKEEGSTLQGRQKRDRLSIIPRLQERPILGWGFIHHSSPYGQKLGIKSNDEEDQRISGFYSIDSGYLTLLMYFGVFGSIIILWLFVRLLWLLKRDINEENFFTVAFSSILLLALLTHGGIFSDFGLVPLCICFGLSNMRYSTNLQKHLYA
ncbi:O-antigen ligase family protein [Salinimicrobium xinjiangense]|uniref:O-antigen ligase family protein n=1 Tax=Salinimicrobium xinjiangense TaxID=438596 RepID=UPI00146D7B4C|nr:O-antigen ligase family protein [Salinimicrobium xinjiangense]